MQVFAKITNLENNYSELTSSELRESKIALVNEFMGFYKGSKSDRNAILKNIWRIGK